MNTIQFLTALFYAGIVAGFCWFAFSNVKFLPNKKRAATMLGTTVPFWVWACAGLLIGLMVVVVGTIIIVKLYYTIKIVLPDNPPPTNNVQTTYYYDHGQASVPQTNPVVVAATFQSIQVDGGVALQYGVCSTNGLPWICLGTNLNCEATNTGYIGVIYTFENDSNCIDVVLATGGTLSRITYTATNDFATNYPVNVFIQSSTNLTDWNTLLDDPACVPDAVANYIDTNPSQRSNFYRIFYK